MVLGCWLGVMLGAMRESNSIGRRQSYHLLSILATGWSWIPLNNSASYGSAENATIRPELLIPYDFLAKLYHDNDYGTSAFSVLG